MSSVSAFAPGENEAAEAVIRTLLLTDLVDSTKLVEKLGDARAYQIATRHDRVSRDLLPRWGGLEIDKTDGFLLLFERPLDAVGYALAYHRALAELSVELGVQLRARAGIHLGEVFLRENDAQDVARGAKPLEVEGLAKPTAARAMSLAGGKQTLLTQGAFDMAREAAVENEAFGGKLRWLAHGPYLFKGVDEPVEIFEVGVEGQAPLMPPGDTAKVRRAVAAGDEVTLGWRPGPGVEIPRRSGWRLDKRLGEGGFGEVWLAVQQSTGEPRVFKFCHDADRLRFLKREVTLFRLLRVSLDDAREIVHILDWSFDRAPYFIEEEYVADGDLLEWADQQGGLREVPLEIRLEIVAQVADALAAAHSVGVLHKDVKPANVLVTTDGDGRPRAKLADFGIAEVADQRQLLAKGITVLGLTEVVTSDSSSSVSGSHLYMAPEVAEGKAATVQADIYALGVMLYQVAVGDPRRALAPGWRRGVGDELLAEDIAHFVDGAPERRPASAREVAERLRGLEQRRAKREAERRAREEAEAARLALERAQRRRKVSAAIAAVATVFLVVVSILAVLAVRARGESETARGVADQRREQAEDLISFMLGDLREKLEPVGRLEILDDVGAQAMEYFAAVPEGELSDEELARRSKALYQIGDVRIRQGDLAAAKAPLEESLALARVLVARDPENGERLFGLGQSYFWVGYVHWEQGDLDGALRNFQPYLMISGRLVARDPENRDWQMELAYANSNIGSVLEAQGRAAEAVEHFRLTVDIKRRLVDSDPSNRTWQRELGDSLSWLGQVLEFQGPLAEALELYQEYQAVMEQLVSLDPENARWQDQLGISHGKVGGVLLALGRNSGARRQFEKCLAIRQSLADRDSTNTEWRRDLANVHHSLGGVFSAEQNPEQTLWHLHRAREILQDLHALDGLNVEWRRDLADVLIDLDKATIVTGSATAAQGLMRQAFGLLDPVLVASPDDIHAQRLHGKISLLTGSSLAAVGQTEAARQSWRQAITTLQPIAERTGNALFLEPLALALLSLDRIDDALPIAQRLHRLGYHQAEFRRLCKEKGVVFPD